MAIFYEYIRDRLENAKYCEHIDFKKNEEYLNEIFDEKNYPLR